ncbi:MAG: sugar kinase [Deltaproteobacteria bacterium]|nr:sugar kinase [Deltaproteobacteria bacterium]
MSILVVGSIAFDSIETPRGKAEKALGGSAQYFSIATSFFNPVSLVGVVGQDFPQEHLSYLSSRKVCLKGLQILDGQTFHWAGRYDDSYSDPQTLSTHLNVFENFSPQLPESYKSLPYVFLGNIDPLLQSHVLDQMQQPRIVACDTMNFWIGRKKKELLNTLSRVDIFFINETEAKELSAEKNLVQAARKIRRMGPRILVVKRGEYGSLMFTESSVFACPAYPLSDVVDPTGAGDSFAGGFMGYLAKKGASFEEDHLRRAVVYGNTMASFAIEDYSFNRLKSIDEALIEARFKEFSSLTGF